MAAAEFGQRNAEWTGAQREFHQENSRTTAPRVWGIKVVDNEIHTYWGQLGGIMQTAIERMGGVNVGKANEMSPHDYALDRAQEMCRKKHWEGYRERNPASNNFLDPPMEVGIDFDDLPLNLCFYKPDNSMGAGITQKAKAGKVLYSRKRNGSAYIIARGDGLPKLYSRRMLRQHDDEIGSPHTWDERFPHIVQRAAEIMPPQSILLGELIVDRNGQDDFKHVQSLTKSLTDKSIIDQHLEGLPAFYCWDVAFWRGEDLVRNWNVRARYNLIHELHGGLVIQPVEFYDGHHFPSPEAAVAFAKDKEWEGWVVVDPDGVYGDRAYNFKGKPDRPGSYCAKLKAEFEDDFIAIWDPDGTGPFAHLEKRGERSTKDRSGQGIKSVALYQWNKHDELVYISKVSAGMTDEMRTSLANPMLWPRVWKVIYTERTYISQGDDTNALLFPRFGEERADKQMTECVNMDL